MIFPTPSASMFIFGHSICFRLPNLNYRPLAFSNRKLHFVTNDPLVNSSDCICPLHNYWQFSMFPDTRASRIVRTALDWVQLWNVLNTSQLASGQATFSRRRFIRQTSHTVFRFRNSCTQIRCLRNRLDIIHLIRGKLQFAGQSLKFDQF